MIFKNFCARLGTCFDLLADYKSNRSGSFAVQFALTATVLLSMVGFATDVTRIYSAQEKLQDIVDAGALYAINGDGKRDEREARFKSYVEDSLKINSLFMNDPQFEGTLATVTETRIEFESTVRAKIDYLFIPVIAKEFVIAASVSAERGLETIEVALAIDVSSSMQGERLTLAKEAATEFVETLLVESQVKDRVSIALVPFGGTVRVPETFAFMKQTAGGTTESNSSTDEAAGTDGWNQCFKITSDEIEDQFTPSSRFEPSKYFWKWYENNPWCPRVENELVPLTQDSDVLINRIADLSLSDGTGTDHAMEWARIALTSSWKNYFDNAKDAGPKPVGPNIRKIIVVMSDGAITGQAWLDENKTIKKPLKSNTMLYTSGYGLIHFQAKCTAAKQQGIEIYSIGFLIKKTYTNNKLKSCATDSGHFYKADAGSLKHVFTQISALIAPSRLKT